MSGLEFAFGREYVLEVELEFECATEGAGDAVAGRGGTSNVEVYSDEIGTGRGKDGDKGEMSEMGDDGEGECTGSGGSGGEGWVLYAWVLLSVRGIVR